MTRSPGHRLGGDAGPRGSGEDDDARVVKRSLVVAGHRTSVSLEDAFWRRLRGIAAERGLSINALAAIVDASRGEANLSSALRVYVLEASSADREPVGGLQ
jgi:predicted DNA-binding ribbon-helix-helix protein